MTGLLKRLYASRFRISTRLYLGIACAVSVTFVASLVGWFSFGEVGRIQNRVNEGSVPALAAAFGVAQQSGALVAAAPRVVAASNPRELAQITGRIVRDRRTFETQLAELARRGEDGDDDRSERLGELGAALSANIQEVLGAVLQRFALTNLREELRAELSGLVAELTGILVPAIDNQLFFAMTGYRSLDAAPAPREIHFSEREFTRYRRESELLADATAGAGILETMLNTEDASLLEPLRDRFEANARGINRHLNMLGDPELEVELRPRFARLIDLGIGMERTLFELRAQELELEGNQRELLARNRDLALSLVAEAEGLVGAASESAREATLASARAILTGQNLLFGLSIISIVGAVLIAWLYVGRVVVSRLQHLSERMRRMADGDLEEQVEMEGRDEVADMASALEVFRRHALEVQRLNLVEKLAGELQDKNSQLEDTLSDLNKAQDQIVTQEKLAALGELTAGVAHEIRNPLNFVKNFSESSVELIDEMLEEMRDAIGKTGEDADKEQQELIDEIAGDVTDNLKRIIEHGARADRIVESMLMMGRDAGERMETDVNEMIDEHARLAYHSARATDTNFRMEIEQDFDPNAGQIDAVRADLGRVFLNMVGNACHATDARRRAVEAEGGPRFDPVLRLTTRGMEDSVEIRLRDNGTGIPPEVIDKIFNPFFTTKPTDQGTGLGLALSSDIVRQHGGIIEVKSEPGEYTEMIVQLPRRSAVPDAEDANGGAGTDLDPDEDDDEDMETEAEAETGIAAAP